MGRLDIRICEARNLPDTQAIGKPDPYCIVRCENQQHKTRSIDDNLNPKWEEVFKFQIADENSAQLRFELWNKNLVSDELLGMYTLSIAGLKKGLVKDEWHLLQKCKGNAELRVRMCALDFGNDPTPEEKAQMAQTGTQVGGAIPAQAPMAGAQKFPQQYPPQQTVPQQQYPPVQPQPGYPPQQPGYPPQQPGYPPQQPGYPPQQPGYPPQQPGYPPQQPGYPPQQPGYPPQQPGYPPQQPGYPVQPQPGYPPQQPGYPPQQPGYPPQQPGYQQPQYSGQPQYTQQPGYPAQPGYPPQAALGYPPQQPNFGY